MLDSNLISSHGNLDLHQNQQVHQSKDGSLKSTPLIQHVVYSSESLPLPLTLSAGRSGIRTVISPDSITVHQPTIAKVGEVVHKIPTAVSHQSHAQTIVHNHARLVTPIVAPAVRTQVYRAYQNPQLYTAHAQGDALRDLRLIQH